MNAAKSTLAFQGALTVDVEDWFHVLDSPATRGPEQWSRLESRVEHNVRQLMHLLARAGCEATFFWLGWLAERHGGLVRECVAAGHEVASHGYAHVLPYQVGAKAFAADVRRAKDILEQVSGTAVTGFRAPGFGITHDTPWAFDIIRSSGHAYDSSVFPLRRNHGGMPDAPHEPYTIETPSGGLREIPMSVVTMLGLRYCMFSGGYLRITPKLLLELGGRQLCRKSRPIIALVHPRELDVDQPRLSLSARRSFMYYAGLRTTADKLDWFVRRFRVGRMEELGQVVL